MIRNGELSASEAKRVLKRYWWVLPLMIIGGVSAALVSTIFIPKKFKSETLVLVEQPNVSPDLVKPVVTEATNQRLASMQEQILSRSRLQPIIEKFGLYMSERDSVHMEDLVERLRSAIEITALEPMQGTQNRQLPGFHVNVTYDDPQTAQRICSEITTMFLQQNQKYLDDQGTQTTDFLARQVEEAKRNLDEQDAKLAEFKSKYMGSLPDREQTNLSLLGGMNSQLDAITQALSREQQEKAMNESLLSSQLASLKASRTGETAPETMDQQLNALQDQLSILLSRYTPDHPDVIKTKNQIELLKHRMNEAPKVKDTPTTAQNNTVEPPAILQLRARLRQNDISIAELSKRQGHMQAQITTLQGQIQSTPAVEQQYKELSRGYQTALDGYNDLLKRHDQAAIGRDLNRQQQGEQFRVLDAASLPMTPSFPKKPVFGGVGAGAGLVLGLVILYMLAALDSSMHTERDVEVCMQLPVLAMVPNVTPAGKHVRKSGNSLGLAGT
ncbi:MAG TPA: Wzz/FepE/Etk N-terminal domain-containing protein [Candidatus Acidoferrum sp.]|jgi:polysaccharide chain length determinant protein (PEP-CTERM system associated)